MSFEIIGILPHRRYSEVFADPLSAFDASVLSEGARALEAAGFERVLIANSATYPDSMPLASWVLAQTTKLKVMIAHRPGFIVPTMAARMLAALDRVSEGRAGVHIITGTDDKEMQADGDFLTKDERYARSREYVAVMKRMWREEAPFDHDGAFYRFNGAFAAVKPARKIPVFWGGLSDAAVDGAAAVADIFAFPGLPLPKIEELIARTRSVPRAPHDQPLEYLVTLRMIVGATERQAWDTVQDYLRMLAKEAAGNGKLGDGGQEEIDACVAAATEGSRFGTLFNGFGKVPVGRPMSGCVVGTVDQLLETLMAYRHAGIDRFIMGGYGTPAEYARELGDELLPRFRAAVAADDQRRDAGAAA